MAFYVRCMGRVSLCIFCLFCIFSGIFSNVLGDSLGIVVSKSSPLPGVRQDSDSTEHFVSLVVPPKASDTTSFITLDKMVVTASRRQRLLEASQSLSIIKPSEWLGTNKTVADVVAEQTGVQTRRYGGTGSFQTVSIRGVQGSEVLVLLDGIPLNSAMGGAVDLSAISPDRISEIEVYKGITPGEFGGSAIGGVINIKSKIATGVQAVHATTAIGAYGYQKYAVETNHFFTDNVRAYGTVDFVKSDNNWPYLDRHKTPYNVSDDVVRTLENHGYDFFEARFHPSFGLPNGRTLTTGIAYSTSEVGIPASEGSINRTAKHGQDMFTLTSRLSSGKTSENAFVALTPEIGYLNWSDNTFWTSLDQNMGTFHGGIASSPNSYGEYQSDLQVVHASCIADIFFSDNLGGQATLRGKHSQIATSTYAPGFSPGDWPGNSQEATLAADVNGSLPLGILQIGATGGGSAKGTRSATKGGRNELVETTVVPTDTFEYPWSLHGGIHLRKGKVFNVFANVARYRTIPSLRDKYGTSGIVVPNPSLKQETGTTIETGVRLVYERFFAEAIVFRTETINQIVMLAGGYSIKPVNLGAGLTSGLEMTASIQPLDFCRTELRATLQNALNHSRLYNYYGKRLPNEPDLAALAKVSFGPLKGVELHYWLDYKSFFFRDYGNTQRVPETQYEPGMVFHNAQITWKAPCQIDVGVSIRNFSGTSLRYEEMARSVESGYSWVLYPANEWCFTASYSFCVKN